MGKICCTQIQFAIKKLDLIFSLSTFNLDNEVIKQTKTNDNYVGAYSHIIDHTDIR